MDANEATIAPRMAQKTIWFRFVIFSIVCVLGMVVFWDFSKRHFALFLVLIGVAGETLFESKPKALKEWVKFFFALLLIIGLTWELPEAAKSDRKAAEAEEHVKQLESTNLVLAKRVEELRQGNLELLARIQPRRVSAEQKAILIRELRELPNKCKLVLRVQASDIEARVFSLQLKTALNECNFDTSIPSTFSMSSMDAERVAFGISLAAKGDPIPAIVTNIVRAFALAGIVRVPPALQLSKDKRIADNAVEIRINAKPLE